MNNEIIKKNIFFSDEREAIKFFGSRRLWWVGRKGETNDILFLALPVCLAPTGTLGTYWYA
jgi:hypothetical protein